MRLRERVDVADRDEAVRARDVVALGDEAAEEAVLRLRRQGSPPPRARPRARARSRPTLSLHEPRRVVVRVSASRPVDEHAVGRPELCLPAAAAELVAKARVAARSAPSSRPRAPCPRAAVTVPGRGEYGKTCTFVIPARSTTSSVRSKRLLVLAGKADDHVGGEVEVRERLELREELGRRVAPPHRAEHAVVPGLQRNVEMWPRRKGSRAAPRSARRSGGSPRWTTAGAAPRRGSLPPRARVARACSPPHGHGSSRG